MKPPLIVTGEGEALVFESAEDLCGYLEWIDVEDGVYDAWDSEGRRLSLTVERKTRKRRWLPGHTKIEVVHIQDDPSSTSDSEALRRELFACLSSVGESPEQLSTEPLSNLIDRARGRFGPTT